MVARATKGAFDAFPPDAAALQEIAPVYEWVTGWQCSTKAARSHSDLPSQAIAFIARIEEFLRVPVALVSVGADRTATFARLSVWEAACAR